MRELALVLALAALAACGAQQSRPRIADRVIDRALSNAPGLAQPSKVVAADLAFARAAREEGQWSAFRRFAASGAVLHWNDGVHDAVGWLAGKADPERAVQWAPRSVWMSCDGTIAVSQGRFVDPRGVVGNYITVWRAKAGKRRKSGEAGYQYLYDTAQPDDPQPPPRERIEEGDIVVTALDAVKGIVADCPARGAQQPAPPEIHRSAGDDEEQSAPVAQHSAFSPDGTLRWGWQQYRGGTRRFTLDLWRRSGWQRVLDETMGAPAIAEPSP